MCTFFRFDLLKLTSALHRQDNTFVKKLTPLGRKHRLVTTLRTLRAISAEHRFAFVPNLVPRIRVSLVQQNGHQHRPVITLRIRKAISTEHPFLLVPNLVPRVRVSLVRRNRKRGPQVSVDKGNEHSGN